MTTKMKLVEPVVECDYCEKAYRMCERCRMVTCMPYCPHCNPCQAAEHTIRTATERMLAEIADKEYHARMGEDI